MRLGFRKNEFRCEFFFLSIIKNYNFVLLTLPKKTKQVFG